MDKLHLPVGKAITGKREDEDEKEAIHKVLL